LNREIQMILCRRSSSDWHSQGGMSRRASGPTVNFSSHVSGVGIEEPDGGIPTYHTPMSQTFTAVDFDMQVRTVFWHQCLNQSLRLNQNQILNCQF